MVHFQIPLPGLARDFNVTIHAVEHDIVLTHDIVFDYIKTGKISPVLNLNY